MSDQPDVDYKSSFFALGKFPHSFLWNPANRQIEK